jgi:hypothetical protein
MIPPTKLITLAVILMILTMLAMARNIPQEVNHHGLDDKDRFSMRTNGLSLSKACGSFIYNMMLLKNKKHSDRTKQDII